MTTVAGACTCAIPEGSQAPRCPWCPAPAGPRPPVPDHPPGHGGAAPLTRLSALPEPAPPAEFRYSRWAKGPTTFGPLGRVLATLALLVPLPVLAMSAALGVGIVGAGIYCIIVMPWALRHIWAKAKILIR